MEIHVKPVEFTCDGIFNDSGLFFWNNYCQLPSTTKKFCYERL